MRTTKAVSVSFAMGDVECEASPRSEESVRLPATLAEAVRLLREDAREKGTDRLTMREINAEIAAVRREKGRKSKAPVA